MKVYKKAFEEVVGILMERDGWDREKAEAILKEVLHDCFMHDVWDAEEVWMEQIGLEPDYLYNLMHIEGVW